MLFDDYQKFIKDSVKFTGDPAYLSIGLCEEAGEVAGKIKKIIRDKKNVYSSNDKAKIMQELGDTLSYVAMLSTKLGYSLDTVARMNMEKLRDRVERGVVYGEGDDR